MDHLALEGSRQSELGKRQSRLPDRVDVGEANCEWLALTTTIEARSWAVRGPAEIDLLLSDESAYIVNSPLAHGKNSQSSWRPLCRGKTSLLFAI